MHSEFIWDSTLVHILNSKMFLLFLVVKQNYTIIPHFTLFLKVQYFGHWILSLGQKSLSTKHWLNHSNPSWFKLEKPLELLWSLNTITVIYDYSCTAIVFKVLLVTETELIVREECWEKQYKWASKPIC